MLLTDILKDIDDDATIYLMSITVSLERDLLRAYNKVLIDNSIPIAPFYEPTGKELKLAIGALPAIHQITLLFNYNEELKTHRDLIACPIEDPRVRDERQLKHWIAKAFVITFAIIVCVIFGAMVVVGVHAGLIPDSTLISGVMKPVTELLKFILSTGK